MSTFHRLCLFFIAAIPLQAQADYGLAAISLTCDFKANTIEIQPLIIWNGELDFFLSKNPSRASTTKAEFTKVFDGVVDFSRECRLKNRTIRISIRGDELRVQESGKAIASKRIKYVWYAHGEEYSLKSRADGQWHECVGSVEGLAGHPVECGLVTASETTDAKDIDVYRAISSPKSD